ncbi:hypothetical protein [Halalkalicoccus sp. NIPERK01]|uniref:hypothetical protein n=1 Tax=Halalkalicoccus sp. NIPERK01 TaxID=3053469 RepID=UPI00256EFF48|nr:hypothetical protein [Halalkalicoccus sp. NIPERK01]MDL5362212.1 hypothetical protein [Halalkalicoccus sp. NIPERK01]
MRGLAFQAGITALLFACAGLLALLALSPPLPFSECVPVVEVDRPAGGPALYGLDGTELRYTPDGGLECSTHVAVPGLPFSLLALGGVLVAVSLVGRN